MKETVVNLRQIFCASILLPVSGACVAGITPVQMISDVAKWSLRVVYLTVAFPLLTVTHSFVSAVSATRFTT